MEFKFVTLTPDNLASEHLSCIIRTKKAHPGVEAKRRWLAERLPEGHVFRKLDAKEKETAFIEYAPLETAWVPITGDNYLYLYCLWVTGSFKGKGIGQALMDSCLADAKRQGKAGVCMLGSHKQKSWLSDQAFAKKQGFDDQCPFIAQYIERVKKECETQAIPLTLRHVDSLEKAKALPCVFNNWACFYKGKFETVNLLNPEMLKRILK